jgi:hypothetical protein
MHLINREDTFDGGGLEVFKFCKGGLVERCDSPRAQIKLKGRL